MREYGPLELGLLQAISGDRSPTGRADLRVAFVVTSDQHSNAVGIHNAKQNRVREKVNDTAPDLHVDERKQQWHRSLAPDVGPLNEADNPADPHFLSADAEDLHYQRQVNNRVRSEAERSS